MDFMYSSSWPRRQCGGSVRRPAGGGTRSFLVISPLAIVTAMLLVGVGGSSTASTAPATGASSTGLVKIGGGRKLFLKCRGTGTPTVVLISGFRGGYDDWTHVVAGPDKTPVTSRRAVFPRIGRFTRVCAYDRPGTVSFGGAMTPSTPVRQPTTAKDGVADLHALLGAAGEQAPYLLVAHSWGGMIARLYAGTYPQEVAGLVLVDPGSVYLKTTLKPRQWNGFARTARRLGEPKTLEAADYEDSVREIRGGPPVPKIPAVVLTSDHPFDFGAGGRGTWQAWVAAQNRLAASLDAEHVTDTDSGHYIAGERPGLVVAAVRRVRDKSTLGASFVPGTSSRP
jgi:pimeloyl-ACP methyl ester carboxylesterase